MISNIPFIIKFMMNKSSVRLSNLQKFNRCILLRKQGLSYGEIRKQIPIAKSTLNNWFVLAGLTLTAQHMNIQRIKRSQNHFVASEASRIIRNSRKEKEIEEFIEEYRKFINDPLFVAGIMLYAAEGNKASACRFSNSDYRLIETFIKFIEKYFRVDRTKGIRYRLYIHETRKNDLEKIKKYWSTILLIREKEIRLSWKKNKIKNRRENPEYVGQFSVEVQGISFLYRKLLAMSSIMLDIYCRVV